MACLASRSTPDLSSTSGTRRWASFHIGFIQPSEERVDELKERLKQDGFPVKPPRRFHGSWTFYFRAPGGFTVEVLC